ncbi:unnamed protein product [Chrysodeixis includens]|uniref:Protein phosphatase 1 regulatory subunit 14B n=1 Tax=Chrysodeixis includens TaxID=689277 RepID=A0A9P0BM33_CHRIL|nr:unnamed protein product [Chrysodeixis includens]
MSPAEALDICLLTAFVLAHFLTECLTDLSTHLSEQCSGCLVDLPVISTTVLKCQARDLGRLRGGSLHSLADVCTRGVAVPAPVPSPGARLPGDVQKNRGSASSAACGMECGVAAGGYPAPPAHPALSPTERSPAKSGLHVNFSDKGEVKERREKFLTAKYGSHQMALIRKRLAVEMWLYDELQKLYETPKDSGGGSAGAAASSQEVEVDIDELLDMDSDELRRRHLTVRLLTSFQRSLKKPPLTLNIVPIRFYLLMPKNLKKIYITYMDRLDVSCLHMSGSLVGTSDLWSAGLASACQQPASFDSTRPAQTVD